jgi:hypothetical protein
VPRRCCPRARRRDVCIPMPKHRCRSSRGCGSLTPCPLLSKEQLFRRTDLPKEWFKASVWSPEGGRSNNIPAFRLGCLVRLVLRFTEAASFSREGPPLPRRYLGTSLSRSLSATTG